jgi:DNA-directed RNA polymerase specialized sigma24 family protein
MNEWDRVVRQHGPGVCATAWRILGDAAETEGVVQEVFQQARKIARSGRVSRWDEVLRRLTAHAAIDRLRQRRTPDGRESGAAGRLRSALARLPCREAAAFALRYFDDLPIQEIAETLLLSRPTVATCLALARGRLEALLAQPPGAASAGALHVGDDSGQWRLP